MRRYLLPALIIIIVATTGCKKDPTTNTGPYIQGSFSIKAPSHLLVSQSVDVMLNISITEPTSNISYEFSLPNFSTETVINSDGIITGLTAPDTHGKYTITATATHPDYNSISALQHTVTVIDLSSQDSYNGYTNGESSIVDTRDNTQYHYTHIGTLDWFTSNLQWEGAGQSIDSVKALDYIYGRLYTWEEATGGVSTSGLGGGPQGVCPTGWSVPTKDDWEDFAAALKGAPLNYDNDWAELGVIASAEVLINGDRLWTIYSPDNRHTNTHKWNGIPAGSFAKTTTDPGNVPDSYLFLNKGRSGFWWSATESSADKASYRSINDQIADFMVENNASKEFLGVSVRCVRIH